MMNHLRTSARCLAILALAATLTAAAAAAAQDDGPRGFARDRRGLLVGFNAGFGGSNHSEDLGKRTVTDDPFGGGLAGLRIGYAFSNAFALTLEGHGFGSSAGGSEEWGLGAGFVTATWWPRGGGLFVRGGVGAGGGEILLRKNDALLKVEDRLAALFGIGYEWQLGRRFALAVAADGFGFDLDGASEDLEDTAGASGVSIQLNWYL